MELTSGLQILLMVAGLALFAKSAVDYSRRKARRRQGQGLSIYEVFEADPVAADVLSLLETLPATTKLSVLGDETQWHVTQDDVIRALDGGADWPPGSLEDGIVRSFDHALTGLGDFNRRLEAGSIKLADARPHLAYWARLLGDSGPSEAVVRAVGGFIRRGGYSDAAELLWKLRAG